MGRPLVELRSRRERVSHKDAGVDGRCSRCPTALDMAPRLGWRTGRFDFRITVNLEVRIYRTLD
jgi:hypothetical protein